MLVAGVDSSTQSTKVVLCRAEDGAIVATGSAPHPDGTECDPAYWWEALCQAGDGLLDRASAIGVAAQQHGMVALDDAGEVIRPAILWNDMRAAPQTRELIAELGGQAEWARRTGSVPAVSFTVTKLRWMAEREPESARRLSRVVLPHDWLTWRLGADEPVTDRGDASGTGYFSPAEGQWLPDIAEKALGRPVATPRLAAPAEVVGRTTGGAVLSPGTGDNMGAALGLGVGEGDVVVSIGTSGTAYAVTTVPAADTSGAVAGFADATGRFLPLVATVNAARVMTLTARLLGTDTEGLSELALAAPPGAGGLTLLPYFDGERVAQPAGRHRGAERHHRYVPDTREHGPGGGGGRTVLPRRRDRQPRRVRYHPRAGGAHRRSGPVGGRAVHRARRIRRAGHRARPRRIRGHRRRPAGRLGAVRGRRAPGLAGIGGGRLHRRTAPPRTRPIRHAAG